MNSVQSVSLCSTHLLLSLLIYFFLFSFFGLFLSFSNYYHYVSINHYDLNQRLYFSHLSQLDLYSLPLNFYAWPGDCCNSGSLQFFPYVHLGAGSLDVSSLIALERAHPWA